MVEVDSIKYLGIVIDKHLKWDPQIYQNTQKILENEFTNVILLQK